MSTSTIGLREERATILGSAKDIVDGAKTARRDLTPTEQDTLRAKMARIEALDAQIKGTNLVNSVLALGTAEDDPDTHGKSVFSESDAHGLVAAIKSRSNYRVEVPSKAALGVGGLIEPSGQYVEPAAYPGGAMPLAALFRNEAAPGPSLRYYRLGSATAEVVAEGGLKPDAGLAITPVDLTLEKLATTSKITDELSEDAGWLVAHLAGELSKAVTTLENSRILAVLGATSGVLTATGATTDVIDIVASEIAAQESVNAVTPSAVVVHPSVLGQIRQAKASTAGTFVIDPLAPGPATLHGVRLLSSAVTPVGTAWVLSGEAVTVYRRGPISYEIGTSEDDWVRNVRTARCEERIGVAVTRPSGVSRITLT